LRPGDHISAPIRSGILRWIEFSGTEKSSFGAETNTMTELVVTAHQDSKLSFRACVNHVPREISYGSPDPWLVGLVHNSNSE
jgi:hypothetical protein